MCLFAAAAALGGCVQIEIVLQLNEDGSGTVTERIVFLEKLANVSQRMQGGGIPTLDELTSDTRVNRRVAKMGKGVSLASKKVEKRPDGTVQMTCVYAFEDVSELRTACTPWGLGWEDFYIRWNLSAETSLWNQHALTGTFVNLTDPSMRNRPRPTGGLSELEAQQVRALLPIFKDFLAGFSLDIKCEIYPHDRWASATKGHGNSTHLNPLTTAGGRMTLFRITDSELVGSDDGLLMVVPWQQVGREVALHRVMPHANHIFYNQMQYPGFIMTWRAYQTPRGREYY